MKGLLGILPRWHEPLTKYHLCPQIPASNTPTLPLLPLVEQDMKLSPAVEIPSKY